MSPRMLLHFHELRYSARQEDVLDRMDNLGSRAARARIGGGEEGWVGRVRVVGELF